MNRLACAALGCALLAAMPFAHAQRDTISIVGSSTVYPFATVVAERVGRSGKYPAPKVESTGTGGGMKLFCAGVGVQFPDIVDASRRIKDSELADCRRNGVESIVEVLIGYDGIVLAHAVSAPRMDLRQRDVWLALAKDVPDPAGGTQLVPNPYHRWRELNPALPDTAIEVLGPPPTSGTRDAFAELTMEAGCRSVDWLAALKSSDEARFKAICHAMREDGAFIEAGENDNLIVQKLVASPHVLGVFGYSFLEQNADKVQGCRIDGVEPDYASIADGSYPVSRPLYFYVKKAHAELIPGVREFVAEFVSARAMGADGYLSDRGLIALPPASYQAAAAAALAMQPYAP